MVSKKLGPKHLPAGELVRTNRLGGTSAMKCSPWDLEPIFGQKYEDFNTSVVFHTVVYQPGRHLCRTALRHQLFITDCHLQKGHECHSILDGHLTQQEGQWWIKMGETTHVFPRPALEMQGLYRVIDVCSGLGAVTRGYEACGAEVLCHVDSNEQFIRWKQSRTETPCIRGNVAHAETIAAVAKCVRQSHVVSAGISCQPFSALGDGRQGDDPRSESFTGTMMLGYFLGCIMYVLECTKEAFSSEWIQKQLECFSAQTGYRVQQSVLHLHEMWPARRTRWWAVVAHAALSIQPIPAMPSMRFMPSIIHVLKTMLPMSDEALQQLMLSDDEFQQFCNAKGGIVASLIDVFKAMPTATHSWGSQLVACLCQCRSRGFSRARLEEKGLYAVLIPLSSTDGQSSSNVQAARHPHPQEVALLNGLHPSHVLPRSDTPLRLELAGVGQLASPLQGAWVLANVMYHTSKQKIHETDIIPRHVIASMCKELLDERDHFWPNEDMMKSMRIFMQEVESLDTPRVWRLPDEFEPSTSQDMCSGEMPHVSPPTLFQAKPLPRLGCGGPSQCNDVEKEHEEGAKDAPSSPAVKARRHTGESQPRRDPSTTEPRKMPDEPILAAATSASSPGDDTHVPPTRFHAMPLPRLGCGGPSQNKNVESTVESENTGDMPLTQSSDHGPPCQHDPYEEAESDVSEAVRPIASRPDINLMSNVKAADHDGTRERSDTAHHVDFYDDAVFDNMVKNQLDMHDLASNQPFFK